jgi:hypothetical protein
VVANIGRDKAVVAPPPFEVVDATTQEVPAPLGERAEIPR